MKYFYLLLIVFSNLTHSQSIDLSNWNENKSLINRCKTPSAENYYIIVKDSANYRITKRRPGYDAIYEALKENRTIKKVFNGHLISSYSEIGNYGNLTFLSDNANNKKQDYYVVGNKTNIEFFIEIDENLFAIGRNLSYKLEFKKKWELQYIEDLQVSPRYIMIHNNKIYAITNDNLYQFNSDANLKYITTFPFSLISFYPFSAVIIENDLYIAMRSGVLRITNFENKPTFHWYEEKE
nr:hypothetical protein [uncultured Flavobacterium sp.]